MMLTAIGAFIGAVLSLIITIIIESLRNPNLAILLEEESLGDLAEDARAKKSNCLE